jgi:hypothetical protein
MDAASGEGLCCGCGDGCSDGLVCERDTQDRLSAELDHATRPRDLFLPVVPRGLDAKGLLSVHQVRAVRAPAGVLLRWRTAPGSRALGFNLYRDQSGKRLKLNRSLIASEPGERGHSWLDRGVPRTGGLRYWIEEVSVNGTRRRHGPILVS